MNHWKITVLATVLGMLGCGIARAEGTFIAAANRTDMVYDASRGIIYIANGNEVLRYGMDCGCMLDPVELPGSNLKGIDLSPDGKTLAVADDSTDGTYVWVDLIDPDTLAVTKASVIHSPQGETGSYSVTFPSSDTLVVAFSLDGTGYAPLRRLDLSTMRWSLLVSMLYTGTVTTSSGDGSVVAFIQGLIGYVEWGTYDPATGSLRYYGIDTSVATDNYGIAANANGTQFAIPNYYSVLIYDPNNNLLKTLGPNDGFKPAGAAYDPIEPVIYIPCAGTGEVRAYDTRTFQQVGSYDFEDTFGHGGARTRLSRDGTLLMVTVTGGVRFVRFPSATPVSTSSNGGRVQITLPSSNAPERAAYGLSTAPAHGQAFINDNILTYVPDPGYSGTDTFTYAVEYHHSTATATVSVAVTPDDITHLPSVSFDTQPVLQSSTPIPGSSRAPGDFNGDGVSDPLWFDPDTSQLGYWTMAIDGNGTIKRTGAQLFGITSGYFIGAAGDLDGDGYTDLVFTSAAHDLWLWTNNRHGGFHSMQIYGYPADWHLVGAGDINGDGKDDLLWLDPSTCQFAYWLMDGGKRIGSRVIPVACGYYPTSIGYFTPSKRLSILWTSAAGDLYMWDGQPGGGFRSYDLSALYARLGLGTPNPRYRWAIGGGTAGRDIGIEWYDPSLRTGFGALLTRIFDSNGQQTGYQAGLLWNGNESLLDPASAGYLIRGTGNSATALDVLDDGTLSVGAKTLVEGNAPQPGAGQWTYPDGWRVVGAPGNGSTPLPWQ